MPKPRPDKPLPTLTALAAPLRAMRKRRGLTQAELAERTGRAQTHISAIERGSYDLRASTLMTIAAALGCEVVLVPKEQASEFRRSIGSGGQRVTPRTILEEVLVPEPEESDGD
jgi:transcriptional regulator with XRE-family HTH domain